MAAKLKISGSRLEDQLLTQITLAGLPPPAQQHRFHPTRKWRFDFSWATAKLAVECDGGLWVKGRHSRPKGIMADMAKSNAATILGWRVLRFSADDIKSGHALQMIEEALCQHPPTNRP